jgi:hypothetical protein
MARILLTGMGRVSGMAIRTRHGPHSDFDTTGETIDPSRASIASVSAI